MKNIILILLVITSAFLRAQSFKADKVSGMVKAQKGTVGKWVDLKPGDILDSKTTLVTGDKSSVFLSSGNIHFNLKESSAISLSGLKIMTTDELILALAMEDMINAPKKKGQDHKGQTKNTGTKEENTNLPDLPGDFGVKRLNGAKQMAESGFKESAVAAAKETFRKYPGTNSMPAYRIYFADILFEKGLYEDAYADFTSIKKLNLNDAQRKEVDTMLEQLSKKISKK